MLVSGLQFETVYCLIGHLLSVTSHNLLLFSFSKTSRNNIFDFFLSFFLGKLSKSLPLKLNISRTAWRILMILGVVINYDGEGAGKETVNFPPKNSWPLNKVSFIFIA